MAMIKINQRLLEEGKLKAQIIQIIQKGTEETDDGEVMVFQFVFQLESGRIKKQKVKAWMDEDTLLYRMISQLYEEIPEEFEIDNLIDMDVEVLIEHSEYRGRIYANITDVKIVGGSDDAK